MNPPKHLRRIVFLLLGVLLASRAAEFPSEVVLNPGYISGAMQLGVESSDYFFVNASNSSLSANTSGTPEAPATYNLTVNVPEGQPVNYKIHPTITFNTFKSDFSFPDQQTTVKKFQTSRVDFILQTPGFIQGTITANGGTLDYAYLHGYSSQNSGWSSSAYAYGTEGGTFRLAVSPENGIQVDVAIYFTDGSSLQLRTDSVDVASGQTLTRNYTNSVSGGVISGTIQINGSQSPQQSLVQVSGLQSKYQVVPGDGPYAITGLADGSHRMNAASYFSAGPSCYRPPDGAFTPNRNPQISSGAAQTVNISAQQAMLTGQVTLDPQGSLAGETITVVVLGFHGTTGGSSTLGTLPRFPQNTDCDASFFSIPSPYSLVVPPGNLGKDLNLNLYRPANPFLNETLNSTSAPEMTVSAGDTATVDFSLKTGSVGLRFRNTGSEMLGNPYVYGKCFKSDSSNNHLYDYNFWAYGEQTSSTTGTVRMVGMEALCDLSAYAQVNGSIVEFGTLHNVRIVPGVDKFIEDVNAPSLTVDSPSPNQVTAAGSIAVTGRATDDVSVTSITVNGVQAAFVSTNNPSDPHEVSFSATVSLNNGVNSVVTVASDASGNNSQDLRNVRRDAAPSANGDSYSIKANTSLSVSAPGVLGNDSDPDGDPLKAILVTTVAHGSLTLDAGGSISYIPSNGFVGSDGFTYKTNDGWLDSNVASVTINVTDRAPVATDDSYGTKANTSLTVPIPGVLANDTDPDGDPLRAVLVTTVTHGALILNAGGNISYTPSNGFVGTDGFTYKANDGALDSNVASVTINVTNRAPVATDDSYSTKANTPLTVPAPGLIGNDTDPDGDALKAILIANVTHGSLSLNANGSFTYTPASDYTGPDSFTYKANDGLADSAAATVALTVTSNTPPAAVEAYSQFDPVTKKVLVYISGTVIPIMPSACINTKWVNGDDDGSDRDIKKFFDEKDDDNHDHDGERKGEGRKTMLCTYKIVSPSGQTLALVQRVQETSAHDNHGKEIRAQIMSTQYNSGPVINAPFNRQHYQWSVNRDGSLKELEQHLVAGKRNHKNRQDVAAKFNGKKTSIEVNLPNPSKTIKEGSEPALLRMVTNQGGLIVEY